MNTSGYVRDSALTSTATAPTDRTLLCPSSTVNAYWAVGNYGLNAYIAGAYNDSFIRHYPIISVKCPANAILLLDSGCFHALWNYTSGPVLPHYYCPGLPANSGLAWAAGTAADTRGRHGKDINVNYIDGHAQSVAATTVMEYNLWVANP